VLEGPPDQLVDWGVKEAKVDKNRKALELIDELIEQYHPKAMVVEDYRGKGSR
jgi:hypothetical protein